MFSTNVSFLADYRDGWYSVLMDAAGEPKQNMGNIDEVWTGWASRATVKVAASASLWEGAGLPRGVTVPHQTSGAHWAQYRLRLPGEIGL